MVFNPDPPEGELMDRRRPLHGQALTAAGASRTHPAEAVKRESMDPNS
jgi:hypothetical protein